MGLWRCTQHPIMQDPEDHGKEMILPDNHDGVITHLEPDTLECEVKWALESITINKVIGMKTDFFQSCGHC